MLGADSALGCPACLHPSTSAQRSLSESCLSLLATLHELVTPQSAEAEEEDPSQDLLVSLPALASMLTALQHPNHQGEGVTRGHPGQAQAWKDQIPTPGIVLYYLSLETPSDLHSIHKPLNCPVSHAERCWGVVVVLQIILFMNRLM